MNSEISHPFYIVHIALNLLGTILLIIGVSIAIFRNSVGSNWYSYHKGCQITAIALISIAVLLGLWLRSYYPRPDATENWWHATIGIFLLILLLIQGWWAIVMNSQVEKETFLMVHRILATLIIAGVIYQVYLGWKIIDQQTIN